jgi:tRNA(adenine34) deaminase
MCAGALVHARVATVVYGAADPKAGAICSILEVGNLPTNHRFTVVAGVLEPECREVLVDFFRVKRGQG